jgi:hypothetical protein
MADAAEKPKPLSDDELATLLDQMNRHAIGYQSDEVSVDQDSNLDRYLGRPYGDEEEGRSTAISNDVAEVVDWALPDLLEPFLAGDNVVEFEPVTQGDEKFADLATAFANHVFYKDNNGVILLHDTVKSGCIQKIGVIKTTWQEEEKTETTTTTGLSRLLVEELKQDKSITIDSIETEPLKPEMVDPEAQQAFDDGLIYTVTMTRTTTKGRCKLVSVPPEEFKVSPRTVDLEGTEYVAHETEVRRGELIDMGFDYDLVMSLRAQSKKDDDGRADTRFYDENRREGAAVAALNELLLLAEEYPLVDVNGDGKLERLQVFRVGKDILSKEEVTHHPFDVWSPDRIPHRLIGLAIADKVKQTAKIKTHLTRNLLDNVYLANNPRFEVPEQAQSDDTIDDLLNVRIGGLIRTKQPGLLTPIEVPDRSRTALDAILYMDGVREQQSGITRNGMAVSSEVIDPKSATEARNEDRNEQVRKRLMCRLLAETLLVPVFRKILRILVTYQDFERWIRINGQFVAVDPRHWNADLAATASVGLGYTNRDEELQAATVIGQAQQMAKDLNLVTPKQFFATASRLVKAVGWRFADKYFVDPDTPEGQQWLEQQSQGGQDPKMLEVQIKSQLEQQKAEHTAQIQQAELQHKAQMAEMQAEMDRRIAVLKAENEKQIAQLRIASETQIARERMDAEMSLATWQTEQELRLEDKKIEKNAEVAREKNRANGISKVRSGGQIG